MTRRTEGPWSARARVLEQKQCACGEWTHCEDGVCSNYCRQREAARLIGILDAIAESSGVEALAFDLSRHDRMAP